MKKKHILIFSAALIILVIDQFTKLLVRKNFELGESIPIISNVFHFTYVTNTGTAFSFFQGYNFIFVIFSLIVVGVIFYLIKEINEKEKLMQLAVGMVLGGTLGNLFDRILLGAVTDFLDFRIWPVFNIADSAVTVSVVLLVVLLWEK